VATGKAKSLSAFGEAAEAHLSKLDDDWARHIAHIGDCRHEPKPAREPYEALVRAIAYQQLHAKAGDAILARFLALYNGGGAFPTPAQVLEVDFDSQRACGFSAAKLSTIRAIAQATIDGIVPSREDAMELTDDELITRLVSLRGIGRWTVEMFLIYTMERPDILPVDDFGVREGYRRLKGLETAPTPGQMRKIGESWSPHRTAAAWYLWRCTA
jgi:DNA-3-methyladenine glycosylase II